MCTKALPFVRILRNKLVVFKGVCYVDGAAVFVFLPFAFPHPLFHALPLPLVPLGARPLCANVISCYLKWLDNVHTYIYIYNRYRRHGELCVLAFSVKVNGFCVSQFRLDFELTVSILSVTGVTGLLRSVIL